MDKKVIALLSDFGTKDGYVAAMKAVILKICSDAKIVDITHNITRQDVRNGAFVLATVTPYFPGGTVFVCVVDPGVGTERRGIVVEGNKHLYVGPDNGLLMLSAQREGIQHVYDITNKNYMRAAISLTFHGRDIFAPVGAYLAKGMPPEEIGQEIFDYVVLSQAKASLKDKKIVGEVLHMDGFGNVITNVTQEELKQVGIGFNNLLDVQTKNKAFKVKFVETYGEVSPHDLLTLIGSSGNFEIAINQGNAAQKLEVSPGDEITISKNSSRNIV